MNNCGCTTLVLFSLILQTHVKVTSPHSFKMTFCFKDLYPVTYNPARFFKGCTKVDQWSPPSGTVKEFSVCSQLLWNGAGLCLHSAIAPLRHCQYW